MREDLVLSRPFRARHVVTPKVRSSWRRRVRCRTSDERLTELPADDRAGRSAASGTGHPFLRRTDGPNLRPVPGPEGRLTAHRVSSVSGSPSGLIARAFLLYCSAACCSGKGGFFMCPTTPVHLVAHIGKTTRRDLGGTALLEKIAFAKCY